MGNGKIERNGGGGMRKQERSRTVNSAYGAKAVIQLRKKLKPGVRPIACMGFDGVVVCAADGRLMAFKTVEESVRFWIKGWKFSIQGLLGNNVSCSPFIDGTLVIFRLAPQ
ncbi:phosphatidylserine decarboxylase, partial [Dionaea muscipula]